MSLLRHVAREVRSWTAFDWPDWLRWTGDNAPAYSGVDVSERTALTFTAVYAAVGLISDTIASLPARVYHAYPNGARYPVASPLWMTDPVVGQVNWPSFVQQSMTSLLLDGNAFWGVVRDSAGRPQALWPLDPRSISVIRNVAPPYNLIYTLGLASGSRPFAANEIVHIRGLTFPGYPRGLSPIDVGRQSIGRSMAALQLGATMFKNGAVPGTVITSDQRLTAEQAAETAKRFDASHAGPGSAFRTVVLGGGAQVKPLGLSPEQMQMLQTEQYGVLDVARLYRVPPHMLGDVERTTSWGTGIAEQNMQFRQHTLAPWLTRLRWALSQLVGETFLDQSFSMDFDMNEFLRPDPVQYADYMTKKIMARAATPNEWRQSDSQNPLPGGDAVLDSVQWQPDPELQLQLAAMRAPSVPPTK
jgi:HK97 family phage portal protein